MEKKRKRGSNWADVDGGYALIIPYTLIRHENFTRLTPYGVKLVIDLCRQFSGYNNGYLCPTWTLMKANGWKSRQTLSLAILELEHYRLIQRTKQGGRNAPNLYALTWWRINEKTERPLDVSPTFQPSNAWKTAQTPFRWDEELQRMRGTKQKVRSSYTHSVSTKHAQRVNTETCDTQGV